MFNEKLFFNWTNKTIEELENAVFSISVHDHNSLRSDEMIGVFEIDF